MMIGGYEDRMTDQWAMARYQAYMIYCTVTEVAKRKDIYDFHPLPGDPTKEEREKNKSSPYDAFVERMKERGLLK